MKYLSGIKKLLITAIGLVFCYTANAKMEGVPPRPSPQRLVNNMSSVNLLSPGEASALEEKLKRFSDSTSNQICIVIIDSLYGYDASEFATEIGHEWKVGQKKFDNGVVILVKPTGERKVFIATGYGLEGAIPDATCEEIVQREIIPNFKQGNYYAGLNAATDVIMALAKGEYNSADYAKSRDSQAADKKMGFLIALGIILLFFIISRFGGGKGLTIGGPGIFFWGGGFGGFGGGSGGSFGGGGGGFGGFGGGDFGGGGAGGSW